jgi:hypothetical protein
MSLDIRVLCQTAVKVMRREGISQKDHVTMPEFLGSGEPQARTK